MPAVRILTICTGNVCRSPLVERVLQRASDEAFGPGLVEVRSAGTGALAGHPMDERSAAVLHDLGGDSTGFVARHLEAGHVRQADLVLAATREHRAAAVRRDPRALKRVFTVRELAALLAGADLSGLPSTPAERVAAVVDLARSRRRLVAGAGGDVLDLVDPFRRDDETYAQLRREVTPALAVVTEALTGRRSSA